MELVAIRKEFMSEAGAGYTVSTMKRPDFIIQSVYNETP
jgi:hypothetical protein